jgi:2-polyprenyl-6-methoxyphenol hydroxylase-like FAD-dependent oxidoreductase
VHVGIEGTGIAGLATAVLLARRGFRLSLGPGAAVGGSVHPGQASADRRPAGDRMLSLPEDTVQLLDQVWGVRGVDLSPSRPLRSRRLAWGTRRFEQVPAPGILCGRAALEAALWRQLDGLSNVAVVSAPAPAVDFRIQARGRLPHAGRISAGGRVAVEGVTTSGDLSPDETLVAAVTGGWIFAATAYAGETGQKTAALALVSPPEAQAPGDRPATGQFPARERAQASERAAGALAAAVEEIWPGAGDTVRSVGVSTAAPAYLPACAVGDTLSDGKPAERVLHVGDAALAVDPLRGDGVGQGLRCALLASAVLGAIDAGRPVAACFAHYRARLAHAFRAHVNACRAHYSAAWNFPLWTGEIAQMASLVATLPAPPVLSQRLAHGELAPLDLAG